MIFSYRYVPNVKFSNNTYPNKNKNLSIIIIIIIIIIRIIYAHGDRANFTGLVLGSIEADLCIQVLVGMMDPH